MATTTKRMLNTVGKRTFIKSLYYKKGHGNKELGKEDVEAADWPDSKDWQPEVGNRKFWLQKQLISTEYAERTRNAKH